MASWRLSVLTLGALLCTTGCGSDDDGGEDGPFAAVNEQVLQGSCTIGTSCHSASSPNPLDLETDPYGALVDRMSTVATGRTFVIPSDPDNSYLLEKLLPNPSVGGQMPNTGQSLSADKIELVRQWIADGAPE